MNSTSCSRAPTGTTSRSRSRRFPAHRSKPFTRLLSPHDYGVYLLGTGFAAVVSVFLVGWFRNLILSSHARNDGTDVRGLVISGYVICCLTAPLAYLLGRLVGLDA